MTWRQCCVRGGGGRSINAATPLGLAGLLLLLLLDLSLLVEDLLRLAVADEKDNRGEDEDDGAPGGAVAETKGVDASGSLVLVLVIHTVVVIVLVFVVGDTVAILVSVLRVRDAVTVGILIFVIIVVVVVAVILHALNHAVTIGILLHIVLDAVIVVIRFHRLSCRFASGLHGRNGSASLGLGLG